MYIRDLVVEVTRKCNIKCDHCLRGEAMNQNIKKEYIDSLLDQTHEISALCFTGGEPTLNLKAMEYFIEQCKSKRIPIGSFYIVTNGIKVSENFVMFLLKLYSYCYDKESCNVQVSNDMYHMDEGNFDMSLLKGLSFANMKYKSDRYNFYNGTGLIKEGRSATNRRAHNNICIDDNMTIDEFENECTIYLNCKGEIINGCDWSYRSQNQHKLCDVGDLTKYYQALIDEQVYS